MNTQLEVVSKSKYHPFWGDNLKVAFESVFDRDAVMDEIEPAFRPDINTCMHVNADSKKIYHAAIVSDLMNTDSAQIRFLQWADLSQARGFRVCFRAKHIRADRAAPKLLFKDVLFGRFGEEKPWSFERGPFMNLEAFTYKDPFKTLYVKILEGGEVVYIQVDMEIREGTFVLTARKVGQDEVPEHLVSGKFPS
jgi:hypothetical protein